MRSVDCRQGRVSVASWGERGYGCWVECAGGRARCIVLVLVLWLIVQLYIVAVPVRRRARQFWYKVLPRRLYPWGHGICIL